MEDFSEKTVNDESIIEIACGLGRLLLQNGAETYRVEETIKRTFAHYGINGNSFATLNTIITSMEYPNGSKYSKIERIENRTLNLEKVHELNSIARSLEKYSIKEIELKLKEIEQSNKLTFLKKLLGNVLVGGAFAILFKGGYCDSVVASISAIFLTVIDKFTAHLHLNSFFTNFIGGMVTTIVSIIFFKIGFISNFSISIISTLMLLVPGISFTNSIRDIVSGDFVSGLSRGIEAVSVGIALASGSGVVLSIFI